MRAPVALKAYLRVIVSFKKTRAQLGMRLGESYGIAVSNGISHRRHGPKATDLEITGYLGALRLNWPSCAR